MMKSAIAQLFSMLIVGAACVCVSNAQTHSIRQPIALLGGQPVYDEDLLPSIGGQLLQLSNQEYELKSRALEKVLGDMLLEKEARSKGVSVDVLLQKAMHLDAAPPTAAEVQAFYLAQKDRLNRPLTEVRPQLENALIEAKRQQARQDYIDQLRRNADVAILLPRPRVAIAADPLRLRGNPEAPVTIVEFSDYQCPYCKAAEPTLKQVLEKYGGKVRLAYRDFPLRQMHPEAQQSAEAARCAADQKKFWEYHDLLYANQARLDKASLIAHAQTAGLNVDQFSNCLASGNFKAAVESDLRAGTAAGVSATPAFYINGVPLTGAQPLSEFEKVIDSELATVESQARKR